MNELRDLLIDTYSDRLIAMILFGSQARGDATPDSDFDVLIVLKDPVKTGKEIERTGSDGATKDMGSMSRWGFEDLR
ncbi:nucleotidyltransferase domain-containing protein [Pseudanabaena sp. FACHB-1277]|uniref:Nucleotidyltransferase domain-containing protein n=1 Tax=Pseudanabaena cinerea FACHB-1277 TaxID=2949581 RepID=A0A926UZ73_9CYAN|nr:nucleotidyltransferase domain-containing protein [Pseudanabaena cinerea]MBD2152712.1 nucleotidyltransferase domain-containing protein [Pseudanabaena cinerea FACHB-1277]